MHRRGEPADSVVKFPPRALTVAAYRRKFVRSGLHGAAYELRNLRHAYPSLEAATHHIDKQVGNDLLLETHQK